MNAKKVPDVANKILDIKDVITNIKAKYLDKLEVQKGKLIYIGTNEKEKNWLENI